MLLRESSRLNRRTTPCSATVHELLLQLCPVFLMLRIIIFFVGRWTASRKSPLSPSTHTALRLAAGEGSRLSQPAITGSGERAHEA